MSIFDVRMYDSAYLNYCNRFPPNEIAQSVEKKNQFGANTGVLKSYLELAKKRMFEEKNVFKVSSKVSRKTLCPVMHLKYAF